MIGSVDGPLQRYLTARDRILETAGNNRYSQVVDGTDDQIVVTKEISMPHTQDGMQSDIEPGTSIHRTPQAGDVLVLHHAPCPTFVRYTDDEVMVLKPGKDTPVLDVAQHWEENEYDRGGTQLVSVADGSILAQTGKPYINPAAHYREYIEEE